MPVYGTFSGVQSPRGSGLRRAVGLALTTAAVLLLTLAAIVFTPDNSDSYSTEELHYESYKSDCTRPADYYAQTLHSGGTVRLHCIHGCGSTQASDSSKVYRLDSSPCAAAARKGLIGSNGGVIQFRLASHARPETLKSGHAAILSKLLPVFGAQVVKHEKHTVGVHTKAATGFSFVLPPPTVATVQPAAGPTRGGAMLTLTGENLGLSADDHISVQIGTKPCAPVTWVSPTSVRCQGPPGAGQNLPVEVTVNNEHSAQTDATFSYHGPSIQAVTPAYGQGGMTVTVAGSGFGVSDLSPIIVVGTHRCASTWVSDSQLLCKVAQHSAGVYGVKVVVDGQSTSQPRAVEIVRPKISTVDPREGGAVGGETLTIRGSGFATTTFYSDTKAWIGGKPCQSTTVVDQSKALCVVPTGLRLKSAAADVVIKVAGVESKFRDAFMPMGINVRHVRPSSVDAMGPTRVTIFGSYFGTIRTVPVVHIGSRRCAGALWVDDHRVTCTVPRAMAAGRYGVRITVNGLHGEKAGLLTFRGPTIERVAPTAAASVGGATVTIVGRDFGAADSSPTAFVGKTPCAETRWVDPRTVTCVVPHTNAGQSLPVTLKVGMNSAKAEHKLESSGAVISSVVPNHATPRGGEVLTIHGSNFGTGDQKLSAKVGGRPCTHARRLSDATVTCVVPGGVGRNLTVSVHIGGIDTGVLHGAFAYDAPIISALEPKHGPATGGRITIHGANFGEEHVDPKVWVGGRTEASWKQCEGAEWASDAELTCRLPDDLRGALSIAINVEGNVGRAEDAYHVLEPTIDTITPSSVPAYGGQRITVHGAHFGLRDPHASILIGGMACSQVVWHSDAMFTCMTTAGKSGTYDVKVTLLHSAEHSATKHAAFTLHGPTILKLSPERLPAVGGAKLTISGLYFGQLNGATGPPRVQLNGELCPITDWHDQRLVCEVGKSVSGWADVSVKVIQNEAKFISGVYLSPPTIKSLQPATLAAVGGVRLTVIGADFGSKDITPLVEIGGAPCGEPRWVSAEQIVCRPALTSGEGHKDVTVTVGGNKSPRAAKLWLKAPQIRAVVPAHGPHQGGQTITLLGSGFGSSSNQPTVTLNGTKCAHARVLNDSAVSCEPAAAPPGGASVKLALSGFTAHASSRAASSYEYDWCSNSSWTYHRSHTSYNAYCAPDLCSFRERDLGQMKIKFENTRFRAPLRSAQLVLLMTLDDRSSNDPSRYSVDVRLNGHDILFNEPLSGVEHGVGGYTVYPNSKTFTNFQRFTISLDDKAKALLKDHDDNEFRLTVHTGWFGFVVVKKAELTTCS